jgi:hypothetical protein
MDQTRWTKMDGSPHLMMGLNRVLIRDWRLEQTLEVTGLVGEVPDRNPRAGRAVLLILDSLGQPTLFTALSLNQLALAKCPGIHRPIFAKGTLSRSDLWRPLKVALKPHFNESTQLQRVIHRGLRLQEALLFLDPSRTFLRGPALYLYSNLSQLPLFLRASMSQHIQPCQTP